MLNGGAALLRPGAAVEVAGLELHRGRRVERLAQRDALLERGGEREDLEGRPRLAALRVAELLRDDVVEVGLAGALVAAHRARLGDRLDVAGARLDDRQGPDRLVALEDVGADRVVGRRLHVDVDRGPDRQSAGLEQVDPLVGAGPEPLVLGEPVEDVVAEERGGGAHAAVARLLDGETEVPLLEQVGPLPADHVELGHPVEHDVAPRDGLVLVVGRVVLRRVLHHPGEQRRLARLELVGVDPEVVPGRHLDAVDTVTEVRGVEVALEDPVLAVVLLQRGGVPQLVELAGVGVVGGSRLLLGGVRLLDERELDQLLGDRRAALDDPVVGLVGDHRPQGALEVERPVLVEAVVLDRHQGLDHDPRDLPDRDVHPVAAVGVERGQHVAVGVEDQAPLRQRLRGELLGELLHRVGEVLGADAGQAGERDRQARDDHPEDHGHGRHDHEMGQHAVRRKALAAGHGHASKSNRATPRCRFPESQGYAPWGTSAGPRRRPRLAHASATK